MRALLDTVRALTGDDAYERYLARHQALHPQLPALSPADFYASEIERRYNGVTRCC
ncbi:MAG: YbdD/YjiX family protein [Rhodocyclaceae bacterium]|nr:YbdD/YjiX family protein [Rhodocyclaceae bacterium]